MKLKRILLSTGTLAVIAAPIAAVVSCDNKSTTKKTSGQRGAVVTSTTTPTSAKGNATIDLTVLENKQQAAMQYALLLADLKDNPRDITIRFYLEGKTEEVSIDVAGFHKLSEIVTDEDFIEEFSMKHLMAFQELKRFMSEFIPSFNEAMDEEVGFDKGHRYEEVYNEDS